MPAVYKRVASRGSQPCHSARGGRGLIMWTWNRSAGNISQGGTNNCNVSAVPLQELRAEYIANAVDRDHHLLFGLEDVFGPLGIIQTVCSEDHVPSRASGDRGHEIKRDWNTGTGYQNLDTIH
jgi:hypothetical protein